MSEGSWFTQGYHKVREVGKRLDEQLNQVYLPTFFLKEGEDAKILFVTDEPFTFYEHFLKGLKRSFTCSQTRDCPLCGVGNKPSFKGGYLIIDTREEEWTDKESGEKKRRKNTLKVMKHGIRALQVLDRKNQKKGLLNYAWVVTRTGTGNNTQYDFEDEPIPAGVKIPTELPNLADVLKPKDREYLIQQLAQIGHGQPISVNVGDEDEGVIRFN